jgi:hypothetical protein
MIDVKESRNVIVSLGVKAMVVRVFTNRYLYNKYLNSQIENLDKEVFLYFVPQLIPCIKLTKQYSSKFNNMYAEVADLAVQFPKFDHYRPALINLVREHRKKYSLAL